MPDSSVRQLSIYLPAALVPAGGSGVLRFTIVDDAKIEGGKRAISRQYRDSNASDAGRTRRIQWQLGGAPGGQPSGSLGHSLWSSSGILGTDFAQNIETRWDRRLVSPIAQTSVTLTGSDPPSTATSYFGVAKFGAPWYFGSAAGGQNVTVFGETNGYLFADRGPVSTQVDYASWTVVDSDVFSGPILDEDHWYGNSYLAMGQSIPLQRRVGASSSGATYADTVATTPAQTVYASSVKRGSDRAWYIDASAGSTFNYAGYTLDAFVNLASPFQVGDPRAGVNGIGPFGPLTDFGSSDNIYSFTDQGKPVPLSKALDAIHSAMNGKQFADPGFGWLYYISATGLRAHALPGYDNPVGVGERMRGFTGHNGVPTAIWAARGELWVVYKDTSGNLWGYRGVFGPETANTGQPLFFPWFYQASGTCNAIFSSTVPNAGTQKITIIRADGTNLRYSTIAGDGRDDINGLTYSTAGGTWYGTTFDKDPNLLKTLRIVRAKARGLESGSYWTVAMGFDTNPTDSLGSTYTTIGSVTANGETTLTPLSGTTPLTSITGRTIKPKLVEVAGGASASTTSPELTGELEIEYDERPEQIEEIQVAVIVERPMSQNYQWDVVRQLIGSNTDGPFRIQLPDDLPGNVSTASGGGIKYAMLQGVTARQDIKDNNIESMTLHLACWPAATAV